MSFRKIMFWLLLSFCLVLIVFFLVRKENGTVDGHINIIVQYPGNIQDYFSRIANNLKRELEENPERWTAKKDRVTRTIELLRNGVFDPNVILLQSRISPIEDSNNPCLTITYLDESDLVEYIRYSIFPNSSVSTLLLRMSDMYKPEKSFRFQRGYMCWIFFLICDDQTPEETSFKKSIKGESYLLINRKVYDNLHDRKGEIVLLDSSEEVLDHMEIEH